MSDRSHAVSVAANSIGYALDQNGHSCPLEVVIAVAERLHDQSLLRLPEGA